MKRLLYLTWDAPDAPYLEGLFFPIFEGLRRFGVETHVVQFSWSVEAFRARIAAEASRRALGYTCVAIPRRPLVAATALAITGGALRVSQLASRWRADAVMARSHLPAAIALASRRRAGPRLYWDSDGLMPDERVDFGGWSPRGPTYGAFRAIERTMVRSAEVVLTRTRGAAALLASRSARPGGAFRVVPNGRDPMLFSPGTDEERAALRRRLSVDDDAPLLVHSGSLGPQYEPASMFRVFSAVLRRAPRARLLLLTGALDEARRLAAATDLPPASVLFQRASPDEVPAFLQPCDAGFAFRRPTLSQRGVSPLKVAEYLLCGVPVLGNRRVGDLDTQLSAREAVLLERLDEAGAQHMAERIVSHFVAERAAVRAACREVGLRHFSLDACVQGYAEALGAAA